MLTGSKYLKYCTFPESENINNNNPTITRKYAISNKTENQQFTIYTYICGDCPTNETQRELKVNFACKPRGTI
jgi:hypothetical protein